MIIDMQKLDAHPDFGWGRQLKENGTFDGARWFFDNLREEVIPNLQKLLSSFRAAAAPVIHVRIIHRGAAGQDRTAHHKRWDILCDPNTPEADFLDEVKPETGEYIFEKVGTSPFNSTGIDQTLRNLGVEQLIVCGVNTTSCVYLSVRDAIDRGYATFVVPDASSALAGKDEHEAALSRLVAAAAIPLSTDDIIRGG